MQFYPIPYYFQLLKSMDWSALLPNPVYSLFFLLFFYFI